MATKPIRFEFCGFEICGYETPRSKDLSSHKQKCTQFPTLFSGTIFHALLHGVIYFVQSVSFINLEMEVSDWLLKNFNQYIRKQFLKLTLQVEEHEKLCPKMVLEVVCIFV